MLMSCQNEFFVKQEQDCKNTFLSNLTDNIDYLFYRGGYNENKYNDNEQLLELTSLDDLKNTFSKTYDALKFVKDNLKYDYIFRTNTSTYINIELLNSFVQQLTNTDEIWGGELVFNREVLNDILYLRGNGLLFSTKYLDFICKFGLPMRLISNQVIDDYGLGAIFATFEISSKKSLLRVFPEGWYKSSKAPYSPHRICRMNNENKDFNFLKNIMIIQIKNWYDRDLESQHFNEIHNVFLENKFDDINKSIEFVYEYSKHPSMFLGEQYGFIDVYYENGQYITKMEQS